MAIRFGFRCFWQTFKLILYLQFRSIVKWFLHKTTKLCELQRLCYADNLGSNRTKGVEYSILMSRSSVLKKINTEMSRLADEKQLTAKWIMFEKAIEATVVDKKINVKLHTDFVVAYRICLVHIYGYKQLIRLVEDQRSIAYDPNINDHQNMLKSLWEQLSDEPLTALISKQWSDIGFQGDDPSTDFRGMGFLSLNNLLYFVTTYKDPARHILMHSLHPKHGFPFAIVGINLTHLALSLLTSGNLKTHFFNSYNRLFKLEDFHKVYCYLFVTFDKLWLESRPQSVMEFSLIRDKFEKQLIDKLADNRTVLKWDPQVDTL
ncbi:ELMO domain-containing protein 2-like [Oppia nitens]|uniref:ELMO domain-containing protein 2-like n=1 Tax=Oppia nitens TaxID=1686743 RepID=UPI0023DADDA8|nr:ELMO domain-containing protein 2-like [Oppia nitens]